MAERVSNSLNVVFNEEILKEEVKVEVKTEIATDSIERILGVSAKVLGLSSKIIESSVVTEGKVNIQICYVSDGEIKKTECVGELKSEKEITGESFKDVRTSAITYKEDADFSGIKLTGSAVISLVHTLSAKKELVFGDYNGELSVLEETEEFFKSHGKIKSVYPIEEEFEIDIPIREVLSQSANASITAVQCGVGSVIVDGEIYLYLTLLQNGEKRVIIKKEIKVPYRAELEYPESTPENVAFSLVSVRSFKTDISVDVEENKSSVTASVILDFVSDVFASMEIPVLKDAFSTEKEVHLEREDYCYYFPLPTRNVSETLKEKMPENNLPEGCEFICAFNEKAEIALVKKTADGVLLTGVLTFTALYTGEEKIYSVKSQIPFEKELLIGDCECIKTDVSVCVKDLTVKTLDDDKEVEACLIFTATSFKKVCGNYVKNVEFKGDKKIETSAISVYLARENETLFSLAKRLNLKPEIIKDTNKDLSFPLDKDERIVIYRKL